MSEGQFPYLHGFSPEEQARLERQANFLEHIVYQDVNFSKCKNVLEVGCGVGAQSEILLRRYPNINLTGIDLSDAQLNAAKESLEKLSYAKGRFNIKKESADDLSFDSDSFDAGFLCWILEHVSEPERVLSEIRRVIRPGAEIIITEVMNSSFFLEPYSPNVWKYWMAFNDHQYEIGGDPFIGAKLGNMLLSVGFKDIQTTLKVIHYDNRTPSCRKEMIDFWSDLLLSGAEELVQAGKVTEEHVEAVRAELKKVSRDPNAVFHYTFMQAKARV
jgi:ubiquinone/menaquinone biosynthesis C-methylase UbiE